MASSQGVVIASNQSPVSVAGTVIVSNFPTNPSVSGTVAVSNFPTNPSISGTVLVNNGSVIAFQGGSPWAVNASLVGVSPVNIVGGSIAATFTPPANQSVSGTVQAELLSTNASVITVGSPVANQSVSGTVNVGNFPATQNVSGSVVAFGTIGASIIGLTPVNVTNTVNVSGSVVAFGTIGASIIGLTPVNVTNTNLNVAGSVVAFVSGLQGASVSGTVNIGNLPTTGTASVYGVLSSVTSVSILSANTARKGATIYNNAGTTVFVELGTPVSTSVFTLKMVDQSYYEVPYGWTGVVAGISTSNAGVITVSELT